MDLTQQRRQGVSVNKESFIRLFENTQGRNNNTQEIFLEKQIRKFQLYTNWDNA